MMGFSAADLIKRSARQILYLRQHPEKKQVTAQQLQGVADQKKNTTSEYVEMRGTYTRGEFNIFFSIDEVRLKGNKAMLIEHKSGSHTDAFFKKSVQQAGAYHALMMSSDLKLETAVFYQNMGNSVKRLDLNGLNIKTRLMYLGNEYSVTNKHVERTVDILYKKALATMDWDRANSFDEVAFGTALSSYVRSRAGISVG